MKQPDAIIADAERAIKLHEREDKGRFGEDGLDINTAVKIIEILRRELVKATKSKVPGKVADALLRNLTQHYAGKDSARFFHQKEQGTYTLYCEYYADMDRAPSYYKTVEIIDNLKKGEAEFLKKACEEAHLAELEERRQKWHGLNV